jgi:hypothetical protein
MAASANDDVNPEDSIGEIRFSHDDSERLIFARSFVDHRYDRRGSSDEKNDDFLARTFNGSFTVPARMVKGAAEDIVFTELAADKRKTALQLKQRWEEMSSCYLDINLASQDQSVDSSILMKAHASGKRSFEEFKAEIYAGIDEKKKAFKAEIFDEIEEKKRAFGHFQTMSACGWNKRDMMNPKPRLNCASSMSLAERLRAADAPRDPTVGRLMAAMIERMKQEDARGQHGA